MSVPRPTPPAIPVATVTAVEREHGCFKDREGCPFGWTPFAGWVILDHAGLDTASARITKIVFCPYCGEELPR